MQTGKNVTCNTDLMKKARSLEKEHNHVQISDANCIRHLGGVFRTAPLHVFQLRSMFFSQTVSAPRTLLEEK